MFKFFQLEKQKAAAEDAEATKNSIKKLYFLDLPHLTGAVSSLETDFQFGAKIDDHCVNPLVPEAHYSERQDFLYKFNN